MNLKNDKGFTLIEILVAVTLLVILAAAGLKVYSSVFSKGDVGAIVNNVNQLETVANEYVISNGGSFAGISAKTMLTDGDLPSNWSIDSSNNTGIIPPNTGIVSEYYIVQAGADGITGDSFDIGFSGTNITDNEFHSVCEAFLNKIVGFGWNGTPTQVSTGGRNCTAIPSDNTIDTQVFYLGFE